MKRSSIHTYLFFNGTCEEALEFYRQKLGASIDYVMRYKESPDTPPPGAVPAGWDDKIMHASFTINDTLLMASDDCSGGSNKPSGFAMALSRPTEAEADCLFAGLSEGGTVQMPMAKTFWSPKFGMLTDRFGIMWMVMVDSEQSE